MKHTSVVERDWFVDLVVGKKKIITATLFHYTSASSAYQLLGGDKLSTLENARSHNKVIHETSQISWLFPSFLFREVKKEKKNSNTFELDTR